MIENRKIAGLPLFGFKHCPPRAVTRRSLPRSGERNEKDYLNMAIRENISVNTKRKLWAESAGYCQNPSCNKSLFLDVEDETVSIANMAHIIGARAHGPRSEFAIAEHIRKNGMENLLMLCLECHKVVDELEKQFGVELLRKWKVNHTNSIASLFTIPKYDSERALLIEIDRLLEENKNIFSSYGPFSTLAMSGDGGDTRKVWRRRCLDTILPNNERIVRIIENHKTSFGYPWEIYNGLLEFKVHAISFEENCLLEDKINDYKTFPSTFPNLIKTSLGIPLNETPGKESEELEFRRDGITNIIKKFLSSHGSIASIEEISRGVFAVERKNGTRLRIFVTHTYFFTEYTYEKVLSADPNVSAIVCSNPYSGYTPSVKERCLAANIGLFKLSEFMGALNFDGERFTNFLLSEDRNVRINWIKKELAKGELSAGCEVYLYGSYLRKAVYSDIDLLILYPNQFSAVEVDRVIGAIKESLSEVEDQLDIQACSKNELTSLKMNFDNRVRVY